MVKDLDLQLVASLNLRFSIHKEFHIAEKNKEKMVFGCQENVSLIFLTPCCNSCVFVFYIQKYKDTYKTYTDFWTPNCELGESSLLELFWMFNSTVKAHYLLICWDSGSLRLTDLYNDWQHHCAPALAHFITDCRTFTYCQWVDMNNMLIIRFSTANWIYP